MRNLAAQMIIGGWGALAVGFGILSRSWETFTTFGVIGLFFVAGHASGVALRSSRPGMRVLGMAGTAAFFGVIVFGLVAGAERVYLVNASSYPTWLASDQGPVNADRLLANLDPKCAGKTAEIYEKDGNRAVVRCGGFSWYDSYTYQVHLEGHR